jgi:hypothetical protein
LRTGVRRHRFGVLNAMRPDRDDMGYNSDGCVLGCLSVMLVVGGLVTVLLWGWLA